MSPSAASCYTGKVVSHKNHTEKLSLESLWVPAMWESQEVNLIALYLTKQKKSQIFQEVLT